MYERSDWLIIAVYLCIPLGLSLARASHHPPAIYAYQRIDVTVRAVLAEDGHRVIT